MLFTKPPIKYTDMAIYVDKTVAKGRENLTEQEENTIFEYLYHLSFMLAHKNKYFKQSEYYDEFAAYLATFTYNRLLNNPKLYEVDECGEPALPPVKSCLNYLKAIIYGRKVTWEQENYSQALTSNSLAAEIMQSNYLVSSQVRDSIDPMLKVDLESYIKSIPKIIKNFVKSRFHERDNKVLMKNICISCLFSIINSISFTQQGLYNLESNYTHPEAKRNYVDKCYAMNKDKCIVLYGVPDSYKNLVTVYVREILALIGKEIKELCAVGFTMPDSVLFDIAASEIGGVLDIEHQERIR